MTAITFQVSRDGEKWAVLRDGQAEGTYATQEAAFETAASRAGSELRMGNSVVVQAQTPTDPAGAADRRTSASDLVGKPVRGDGFS